MNETDAIWYLPAESAEQAGPYPTEQIIEWLWSGKVNESTAIREEGSAEARPLGNVEPFASAIEHAQNTARRRKRRIVFSAVGAVVVVIVAAILWSAMVDPAVVRQGRELFQSGQFADAARALTPYVEENPEDAGAVYLLALAKVGELVTARRDVQGEPRRSRTPSSVGADVKQLFHNAFRLDKTLQEQGKADLEKLSNVVPQDAPDVMVRHLAVARLRIALRLTEPKPLAQELLGLLSARPPDEALRLMNDELALQIMQWDPALADEVVSLALPGENASRDTLSGAADRIHQWTKSRTDMMKVLPLLLMKHADLYVAAGKYEHAEILLRTSRTIDAGTLPEVARRRLAYLTQRLEAGDAAGVVAVLDRAYGESPEMKAQAPRLYLAVAARLRTTDRAAAQDALAKALRLAPNAPRNEEAEFLCIELAAQPDDEKLRRCQSFLRDHPNSPRCAEVLIILTTDASVAYGGKGRYSRAKSRPYLDAGKSAALALMQQHQQTDGLHAAVFALGRRLALCDRTDEALELASRLLEVAPETPLRLDIEQAIAGWRQAKGRGTLPPEFDELADRVDAELKVMALSIPGTVRALAEAPKAVHVIEVMRDCTADRFNSQERELLRQWVAAGGILWVHSDVLSFFDIGFSTSRHHGARDTTCDPAMSEQLCPLLTNCHRVEVTIPTRNPAIVYNLTGARLVPLLRAGSDMLMSMAPYGDGWVMDKKSIDLSKYDGARFWLNLRLFCLGRDIPGAHQQTVQPPPVEETPAQPVDRLTVINNGQELSDTLADMGGQQVIWIRVKKGDIDNDARDELRRWVRSGGVLWLETDAARSFGFRVGTTYSPDRAEGQAGVMNSDHPILEGMTPQMQVGYTLPADRFVVIGTTTSFVEQRITPLLGWERSRSSQSVVCAVRNDGDGVVIFRPAEIDTDSDAGRLFEENLRSFSFETAQHALLGVAPH